MNRLKRASALGLPEVRLVGRGFGGPCEVWVPPRGREAPSAASETRSPPCGERGAPPRSPEPCPFGLAPGQGYPGSFGEVTPRLLTVQPHVARARYPNRRR